jgi:hypothetical protein
MRESLEIAHHHPGRLRVRSDALCEPGRDRAARARCEQIREALGVLSGVRAVRLNERAGSVLVDYEPGAVDPNTLVDVTARAGQLDPPPHDEEQQTRRLRPAWIAIGAARELNAVADELTGGRADLRDLVPMAMTGLAAYAFVLEKRRLPRWDNLAYWAFSIFLNLHGEEIAKRDRRV